MAQQAPIIVVTGVMAAGKSTVAQALAERLPLAAHVRGDAFRRMIVSGRAELDAPLSPQANAQLALRQRLAAGTAREYAQSGIAAVVQDLLLGKDLVPFLGLLAHDPVHLVVLAPPVEVVERREAGRGKTGYGAWTPAQFDRLLREETPRIGLWLDTGELDVAQTVSAILDRLAESRVDAATLSALLCR